MKKRTMAWIGAGAAVAVVGVAVAGYAGHAHLAKGPFAVMAMDMFRSVDADGDGKLTQAEIDTVRNARHAATTATATETSTSTSSPVSGTRRLGR